jgi:hypothetical protein
MSRRFPRAPFSSAFAHLVDAVALLLYPSGFVYVTAWQSAPFSLDGRALSVKKIVWITLFAGLMVGFALGTAFDLFRAGKSIGVMLYGPYLQSSDTAFAAYKTADPTVAIWVLQRHLTRLDELEKQGFPAPKDLLPQRFLTHARLAKLYAARGDSQRETKEIELATATGFMQAADKEAVYRILSTFDSHQVP